MKKVIFAINITLDGYTDHTVMIADGELHDFFTKQLNDVDSLLFGRATFQMIESYWSDVEKDPEEPRSMKDFERKYNAIPKIVFSKTLQKAEWNNPRIVRSGPVDEVMKLKKLPGKNISVDSISIFQELMSHNLIDEYWFLVHPLLSPKGKRLFEGLEFSNQLELADTRKFKSGVVALHYRNVES